MSSSIFKFFEKKENYLWVLKVSHSEVRKNGSKDLDAGKDLANDVFLKLAESSERINFPATQKEAEKYIQTTVKREWISKMRKAKLLFSDSYDEQTLKSNDDLTGKLSTTALKFNFLNNLIIQKRNRFTEQQLKLWECINLALSTETTCSVLQKSSDAVSKLKYKLEMKILKEFHVELNHYR